MTEVPLRCSCGKISGALVAVSQHRGTHAQCHCASCRAAEIYCGQPDPAPEPVKIFQTSAANVRLDQGQEHLAVFSFGEKNLLRWQAACCGTPMFNILRNPKLGFVGVRTSCLPDTSALGPIVATGFIPSEGGRSKHRGLPTMILRTVRRVAIARMSGSWANTPFFDSNSLDPIKPVSLISAQERKQLLAQA